MDVEAPQGMSVKLSWIPARYSVVIFSFLGFFNLYALRVNLSVAIVAMVNHSSPANPNSSLLNICPAINGSSQHHRKDGEFDWDSNIQGIILGSFFYGYICTQLLGGWISQRFGAKHPFGCSVLFSGILALFIPLAARWHYGALIALRVLQGFFQGVCSPSMHALMGKWAPPLERSRFIALIYSGAQIGTVGSLIISGVLSAHFGWESVFYFFGATSCAWYLLWLFFAFDSPGNHPRISEEERRFIINSIGVRSGIQGELLPWKKVLTSMPAIAIFIASFGHNWGFYTLLTNIPTYLSRVLNFSLQESGILSALPYFVMAFIMQIAGFVADMLRTKGILSTTWVRRSFHFTGQLLPSICLIVLGYIGCDVYAAVAALTLAVGTDGIATSGFQANHVDISSTHAGMLKGLSNTFGTIPGMIGPYVVGLITRGKAEDILSEWRLVFFISAGIYIATALFYGVFASGELQSWEIQPTGKIELLRDHDEGVEHSE